MPVTRRVVATVPALALTVTLLAGCCSPGGGEPTVGTIRVGYVPSEDCLTLWVAERDELFDEAGIAVELTAYATAKERDAALVAGKADAVVGDIVSAAKLRAAGTGVRIPTILLGASPAEGRYGIAVKPDSAARSVVGLAGKPVATSKDTLEEYVCDSMLMFEGLGPNEIEFKVVDDDAERLEGVASGGLEAAVLREPYLTLAEQRGAKVVGTDAGDMNLSTSCLVSAERYLDTAEGARTTAALLQVLDAAGAAIAENPASARELLVEKAPAFEPLKDQYELSAYPKAQQPTLEDTEMVLEWMVRSEMVTDELLYESFVWTPPPTPEADTGR